MTSVQFASEPYFVHWGVLQISLANLLVIMLMVVIFVLALLLPFPHDKEEPIAIKEIDQDE